MPSAGLGQLQCASSLWRALKSSLSHPKLGSDAYKSHLLPITCSSLDLGTLWNSGRQASLSTIFREDICMVGYFSTEMPTISLCLNISLRHPARSESNCALLTSVWIMLLIYHIFCSFKYISPKSIFMSLYSLLLWTPELESCIHKTNSIIFSSWKRVDWFWSVIFMIFFKSSSLVKCWF